MTTWQKAIKTAATVFAVFLAISIIGGILGAVGLVGLIVDGDAVAEEMQTYTVSSEFSGIRLVIGAADVTIRNGDVIALESNIQNLSVDEKNGVLKVVENGRRGWRSQDNEATLLLTLPEEYELDSAAITTGAGRLTIDRLNAKSVSLELGAGEVTIRRLNALSQAEIEGGAGTVSINGGTIHNLDADMGIGELTMAAELRGRNEINCGVGKLNLALVDSMENYRIDLDKSIGRATVNNTELRDGETFGTGENTVSIDGGVGEIAVVFK